MLGSIYLPFPFALSRTADKWKVPHDPHLQTEGPLKLKSTLTLMFVVCKHSC